MVQQPPPPPITSSTLSQPKVEKMDIGDIFEPEPEDTGTPISHSTGSGRQRTISGREISPSLKMAKVEEMTGFEKLRDGRSSIKLPKNEVKTEPGGGHHGQQQPQQPTKSMVVSIPLPTSSTQAAVVMPQSTVPATHSSSSSSSHKKHKKEKKNKKEKREKGEKSERRHKSSSNGEVSGAPTGSSHGSDASASGHHHRSSSSSGKKHKHKHKERDRDSNTSHHTAEQQPGQPGLKLKIKPIHPEMSSAIAPSGGNNVVQPLKICIGSSSTGSSASNSNNSSRKRHRQHSGSSNSSMDSMGDPARKMSRVMGTSTEQESTFLSGRVNLNMHQKPKKVVT